MTPALGSIPSTAAVALSFLRSRDPLPSDDILSGYAVGSFWTNQVDQTTFICVGNAAGLAAWAEVVETTPPPAGLLTWTPPGYPSYAGYQQRVVSNSAQSHSVTPGTNVDAVLTFSEKLTGSARLTISGFRNVVVIGGEIETTNNIASAVHDCTGTVHIEGLWIHPGSGGGIVDAIGLNTGPGPSTPGAIIQVQNSRVGPIRRTNGHADGIQLWGGDNVPDAGWRGGCRDLRLDRTTFITDYQGLFLGNHDGTIQSGTIKNTNIRGEPWPGGLGDSGVYLFWKTYRTDQWGNSATINVQNSYLYWQVPRSGDPSRWVTPDWEGSDNQPTETKDPTRRCELKTDAQGQYVEWVATSDIQGAFRIGIPPGGDFAPVGVPGMSYVSPGYQ